MHTIDTLHAPVIVFHAIEPMTVQDVQAMIDIAEKLLNAGEAFALIMTIDGGDSKQREKGANAMLVRWIKQHKSTFSRLCAGVASVVPTSALLALYRPMAKIAGPRMYGCPVEVFTSLEEALDWANSQLKK